MNTPARTLAAGGRSDLARPHVRSKADEYAKYLYEQGVRPLAEKALHVEMLREDRAR